MVNSLSELQCTPLTKVQAEMSIESKERGPEVAVQCAWLISGIAVAYWVDFGFTRLNNQLSWVTVLLAIAVPPN
jgi:hypothetical protein